MPPHDCPPILTVRSPDLVHTAGLVTRRTALGCLGEVIGTLLLTLVIFLVIQTFIAQPYQIKQHSMEATLEPEQFVLVDKLTPRFDAYKRGDIVVFAPPDSWAREDSTPFIKRVIGLGGETVEIRDGRVFVDGTELVEPYLYREDGQVQPTDDPLQEERWEVPDGELFLMGDHRAKSADSRRYGSVPIGQVVGRAWLRYWPLVAFGILPSPSSEEPQPAAP